MNGYLKLKMPHTIISDECEGVALCKAACPVDCINLGTKKNKKGTSFYFIDFANCIDCGVCLAVCPVEGAVIPDEREDLQNET